MASPDLTAGRVMNSAAALLNDPTRTVYTYTAQMPYLNIALRELREAYEQHNLQTVQLTTSPVIPVDAGETDITFGITDPHLPDDFIEPQQVWESGRDLDQYTPMTRVDYPPHGLGSTEISQFLIYVWEDNTIKVKAANADNDLKIDYIRELFQDVVDENSELNVINAATFLGYRTAALCAEFIERNLTSANGLNAYAVLGMDRALGISSKSKQTIATRRRPFRAAYKRRGWT